MKIKKSLKLAQLLLLISSCNTIFSMERLSSAAAGGGDASASAAQAREAVAASDVHVEPMVSPAATSMLSGDARMPSSAVRESLAPQDATYSPPQVEEVVPDPKDLRLAELEQELSSLKLTIAGYEKKIRDLDTALYSSEARLRQQKTYEEADKRKYEKLLVDKQEAYNASIRQAKIREDELKQQLTEVSQKLADSERALEEYKARAREAAQTLLASLS